MNPYLGKSVEKNPTIQRHEIIGRIAAFGPVAENRYLTAGDRVTWAIYVTNPTDMNYIHGMPQKVDKHRSLK